MTVLQIFWVAFSLLITALVCWTIGYHNKRAERAPSLRKYINSIHTRN